MYSRANIPLAQLFEFSVRTKTEYSHALVFCSNGHDVFFIFGTQESDDIWVLLLVRNLTLLAWRSITIGTIRIFLPSLFSPISIGKEY